uniref:Galectin domain-containing protein n=1 Tax=Meloidogyne hapla TaxID=6305 RepID=A0A1I8BIC5_MELHA
MLKQNIFNILLTIFIFALSNKLSKTKEIFKNGNNRKELEKEPYVLSDFGVIHHTIPYLIFDQCMLRPEQKKHGTYSLEFFLDTLFICEPEGFLICYPSQLIKENNKNGTIASIPYRLSSKKNKITEECENKRQEYCNDKKSKICSPGNVAYSRWHGIFVKTEQKDGNKSKIKGKEIKIKEENLQKEFISNINKGAYLYKYIGLWALGLDLLPNVAQKYIHLFIYRGCSCAIQARLTTPITVETPFQNNLNTTQEKHCLKRQTNKTFKLGKVFEKAIFFYIMTDKEGNKGKMELNLINKKDSIIVEINSTEIIWKTKNIEGIWTSPTFKLPSKLIQGNINAGITILIQKHYLWILLKFENNYFALNKFWPNKWWEKEYQFNENIEADLFINGDFIPISVISVGHIDNNWRISSRPTNISKRFVEKSPYASEIINKDIQNGTKFIFRGVYNNLNESKDKLTQILLLHGSSDYSAEHQTKISKNILKETFECVIECVIKGTKNFYYIYINGNFEGSVESELPFSAIDNIMVNGNIRLFIAPNIRLPENLDKSLHKYKLDKLQQNGTIICFEAFVKPGKSMKDRKGFEVNLFHDVYEFSEGIGDTVLKLEFFFDPELYNENKEKTKNFNQKLIMNSFIRKRVINVFFNTIYNKDGGWRREETYPNPLGQTGVNFTLQIDIEKKDYKIIVNEAIDHISYKGQLPIWATEWIMVKGDIDHVKFGNDSEKCKSKIKPHTYPYNIIQIPKKKILKDGSLIIIKGKITEENIIITFLYKALEWHELIGSTVFHLNFTKEYVYMGTYSGQIEWILATTPNCEYNTTTDKKCVHKHELNVDIGNNFTLNIFVRDNGYRWKYKVGGKFYFYEHVVTPSVVEYINVKGLEKRKDLKEIIKLDKLY